MNHLQKYRIKAGYTQQELADLMQVCTKTVKQWEDGSTKPDYEQAYQLASILKVEFWDIFPPRYVCI